MISPGYFIILLSNPTLYLRHIAQLLTHIDKIMRYIAGKRYNSTPLLQFSTSIYKKQKRKYTSMFLIEEIVLDKRETPSVILKKISKVDIVRSVC